MAKIELAPGSVAGLALEGGAVDATIRNGVADVRHLALDGPDIHLNARGQVALNDSGSSNLKYHLQAADLQQIGRITNQPLTGGAVVDGTISGNRTDLRLAGTLDGSNLQYNGNGALDINSTFSVQLPELDPAHARIVADTKATFVKVGATQLQEVNAKTSYADQRVGFDGIINDQGRQLQAKGDAVLHPDHSEVHLPDFAVRTQGIEWRLAGSTAAVQYGGNRLSFENVRLVNANQALEVSGTINTAGEDKTGSLDVRAENIDLVQLQKLLLTDRGIKGQFSADARLTGSLSAPLVVGNVAIANGAFRNFLFQSFTSKVQYTSTGVTVDARLQENPERWLTVTGSAPMTLFTREKTARAEHVEPTATDRVDLTVKSSPIDLGFIQGFTTQVTQVQGTIEANVHVLGSGHDPHLQGTVAIKNGAFSLPVGGTSYTGLDTTIQLTRDKVVIPQFAIRDNHGDPLTIAGELAVHERSVGGVNVTANADDFKLIDNQLGQMAVDARMKLTGELRRPRVEGEIKVESGRVQLDEVLAMASNPYPTTELGASEGPVEPGASAASSDRGATEAAHEALHATHPEPQQKVSEQKAEQQAEAQAAQPSASVMDNLTMDVRLRIPDDLVLRGTDLRPGGPGGLALGNINLTIGGDIRARKQANDTVRLVGTVNTVRGFYEFQGRRFDVTRDGTVRFVGLADPNPILDLKATRLIDGVEARVHVTGTARAPELELSSNPPLDQADILSLIVFNQSINNLNEGQRVSLAQRAGAVAGGFVAAPLSKSIGQALDVDLFEIQATDESGLLGPGVTLGQQVSDHLYVKFHQQLGQQNVSEFIIEYEIANFMRLRASGSPNDPARANRVALRRVERAGADLIFFFSY
jgi:autotransporter translocation and assembly factor TamB